MSPWQLESVLNIHRSLRLKIGSVTAEIMLTLSLCGVVVGWGLHSHYIVKPNLVLRLGWGFDNTHASFQSSRKGGQLVRYTVRVLLMEVASLPKKYNKRNKISNSYCLLKLMHFLLWYFVFCWIFNNSARETTGRLFYHLLTFHFSGIFKSVSFSDFLMSFMKCLVGTVPDLVSLKLS